MALKFSKNIFKRKKYLRHDYEIEGEALPGEQTRISKKSLLISFLVVVVPLFVVNFIVSLYQTIVTGLSRQGETIKISQVLDADWTAYVSLQQAFHPALPMKMYLFLLMLLGLFSVLAYSKFNYKSDENVVWNQKGDSRFTTITELQQQYMAIPEKHDSFKGYGGVPVSHYQDQYFIDTSTVNTAILGVSRSGKGEMIVVTMIDNLSRAELQSSMVVNDPKGELYSASKVTLEKRGYDVEVLNISEPLQGMSYNPLQLAIDAWVNGDIQEAVKRVNTLTFSLYNDPNAGDNAFFNSSAQKAVNGIALVILDYCVKHNQIEKITMHNVLQMLNELGAFNYKEDPNDFVEKNALDEFFKSLPQGNVAKMQYGSTNFAGDKAKGSILATANDGLQMFADEKFAKMTSKSSLDLKQVGFPKNLFFQLDEDYLNKRVTVSFHKNNKQKTQIGSYRLKVKSLGMCNLNFDDKLEHGDLLLIRFQENDTKYRVLYELKFETQTDEQGNVVYQKKEGCEHKPEVKREVTLRIKANTFPKKPRAKMMYSDKPTAVFMNIPDFDKSNHALASIFIKQLYTELAMNCNDTKGKKCFKRVHYILDEFGNMPPVDDMSGILTVCAGRNMLFNLVLQAYSQIEELYDKQAKAIKQNCQNHIYIMSTDEDTIEELSKRAGNKTIMGKSSNEGHFEIDNKVTKSADQQRIISIDRLRQLIEGEMLVIRALQRQDLQRKKVRPYPIFNTQDTIMPYRWQFLTSLFDTSNDLNDIDIPSKHTRLDLTTLYLDFTHFIVNDSALREYQKRSMAHQERQQVHGQEETEESIEDIVRTLILQIKEKRNQNDPLEVRKRLAMMLQAFRQDRKMFKKEEVQYVMEQTSSEGIKKQLQALLKHL
ncbi:type IV secretory system conjugative DNA transfer family protein [Bacillus paramycoides]|uniref:VirD4-like conjugal transfer protein, CD1115 family n=1 Tax=Bacillus paramycoides TaxID=2026194 RepID=UPI0015BE9D62|nr:type IV secretory system conjugative DNA transfer family protein [Bacillus paramycoides]NWK72625.1 type IV secretory system conjugative DNA transfer family protein [Bacillus paramycoides]